MTVMQPLKPGKDNTDAILQHNHIQNVMWHMVSFQFKWYSTVSGDGEAQLKHKWGNNLLVQHHKERFLPFF